MGRPATTWRESQEGLTLLELLVVVTIIGLLTAWAVPRLSRAINESRLMPGLVDMATISAALEQYFIDNARYPNGSDAAAVMNALKGDYLKLSPTFRNGKEQGYLYLTSDQGTGFLLIDLQGEKQDDDDVTPGQQIWVRCEDTGGNTDDRIFTVQQGPSAALTLPTTLDGVPVWVSDDYIDDCDLIFPNPKIKRVTHNIT